ncbi:MAG: transcriptional regulator [Legionellales bacterium RIFCSPHIGHO2_12_FULL_35_11]|nr:MAG: transcriptional regulator [Legionellales bacterium RIFCSPHIGHO2_12_FULL_35_11]
MSKQAIGDNVQQLLKLYGDLSLSDLARETQIPQPTLHHIIEGKTKKPRRQALEALANFFSISIPQLTGTIPLSIPIPEAIKKSLKISTIPLIDWNLAKSWKSNKNDLSKFDQIILEKQVDKNAFALQLQNSNLEPLFQEKSLLIFDPSKISRERDFVLVYFSKIDLICFNRLFIEEKNIYIKQDKKNGNAELIKINGPNDKIIATLIEARLQF